MVESKVDVEVVYAAVDRQVLLAQPPAPGADDDGRGLLADLVFLAVLVGEVQVDLGEVAAQCANWCRAGGSDEARALRLASIMPPPRRLPAQCTTNCIGKPGA